MRSWPAWFALVVALAPAARAKEGDLAAALELFRKGRELVNAGDWAKGCPLFQASLELVPSVGAELNLAACSEHDGKLARALSQYVKADALNQKTADPAERAEVAAQIAERTKALEPRVPKLVIEVERAPELAVAIDGESVPLPALGEPLPVDPGPVVVTARAGRRTGRAEVVAVEGRTSTVALTLTLAPAPAEPAVARHVPTWAWVTGAIGLAAGAAAIGFAVDYANVASRASELCGSDYGSCQPSDPTFDQAAADDLNARKNRDLAAGVALGVAGGAAVTAAIVGAAVGAPARASGWTLLPWAGARSGGVAFGARF